MKTGRQVALFALLIFGCAHAGATEPGIPPEKREAIEKLLEATGSLKLAEQLASVMGAELTRLLRAEHPGIPQQAIDAVSEVVNGVVAENIGTLREITIHIYDHHFTLEEVNGLREFYATELGRKVIQVLPGVMQESLAAGQQWGQALGPEVMQRLKARLQKENITI